MAVSFTESVKPHLTALLDDYNEPAGFLLANRWKLVHRRDLREGVENVLIAGCRGTSG
jgi:hypothetical protein